MFVVATKICMVSDDIDIKTKVGWMLFTLGAFGESVAYLVFETHILEELANISPAAATIVAIVAIVGAVLDLSDKAKGATGM